MTALGIALTVSVAVFIGSLLSGLKREIAFYGDAGGELPDGLVRVRNKSFRFGAELAAAFAATKIVVDLVNPGFLHGFGTKVMNCFAAGGEAPLSARARRDGYWYLALGDAAGRKLQHILDSIPGS